MGIRGMGIRAFVGSMSESENMTRRSRGKLMVDRVLVFDIVR